MTVLRRAVSVVWLARCPLPGLGLLLDGLVDRREGALDAAEHLEHGAAAAAAKSPVGPGLHQRGTVGGWAQAEYALAYRHPEQVRHPPQFRIRLSGQHLDLGGHGTAARRVGARDGERASG